MTRILLARHGTHDEVGHVLSGRSEIGLNATGREEAARLSAWLEMSGVGVIYSSPRRRALETAAPVATRLGLPVEIAPALDEIDFGAFTGRAFTDLDDDPTWQHWNAARATASCPGGETMAAAVDRIAAFVDELDQGPVLLVTHCDMIRGLVARALGAGPDGIFGFACDPGSVTVVERRGAGLFVAALNERPRSSSSSPPPVPTPAGG